MSKIGAALLASSIKGEGEEDKKGCFYKDNNIGS